MECGDPIQLTFLLFPTPIWVGEQQMNNELNHKQERVKRQITGYTLGAIAALLFAPTVILLTGNIFEGFLGLSITLIPASYLWFRVYKQIDDFDYCESCGRVGCDGPPCIYY